MNGIYLLDYNISLCKFDIFSPHGGGSSCGEPESKFDTVLKFVELQLGDCKQDNIILTVS